MPAPAGKVPVLASVRAAYGVLAQNARRLAPIALIGMGALLLVSALSGQAAQSGPMAFLTLVLNLAVFAGIYAAFLAVALFDPGRPRAAIGADAGRLIAAMSIIGFFLLLIMLVAFMAGAIVLGAMLAPYQAEIEASGGDPAVMSALLEQLYRDDPAPLLGLALVYAAVWLALTSRLYLVAPATVSEQAVRTFETWAWTRGAMYRITLARLAVLGPIYLALVLIQNAIVEAVTAAPSDPPALAMIGTFVLLIGSMLALALEAGLSAFLYRGLKPQSP